jgi:hypothetical protein
LTGEECIMRSCMICITHPELFGDQIQSSGMGMTCNTYGSKEWSYTNLVGKPELKRPRGLSRDR